MAVGTLTDEQFETEYTGSETALRGTHELFPVDEVKQETTDNTIARVRGTFTPIAGSDLLGQTVREVGLFAPDENNVEKLVWIGLFPATYIPNPNTEPDIQGSLVITVPIKFNSAETAVIYTSDAAYALQADLDETNANLANTNAKIANIDESMPFRLTFNPHFETQELNIRNYSRLKKFVFNHHTNSVVITGFNNETEIAAELTDNPDAGFEVKGYPLRCISRFTDSGTRMILEMLPVNFKVADLNIFTKANDIPTITRFTFNNFACFANSTNTDIYDSLVATRHCTVVYVATQSSGISKAWISPAPLLGTPVVDINGYAYQ